MSQDTHTANLDKALSILKIANALKHDVIHISHANVLAEEIERLSKPNRSLDPSISPEDR